MFLLLVFNLLVLYFSPTCFCGWVSLVSQCCYQPKFLGSRVIVWSHEFLGSCSAVALILPRKVPPETYALIDSLVFADNFFSTGWPGQLVPAVFFLANMCEQLQLIGLCSWPLASLVQLWEIFQSPRVTMWNGNIFRNLMSHW